MTYQVDDIVQIREELAKIDGGKRPFRVIMFAGLPGVGKTTTAQLLAQKMGGVHFNIDDVKEATVPADQILDTIDPPTLRFSYYAVTIRQFPSLLNNSVYPIITVDETFHLQELRQAWDVAMGQLDITAFWVPVICSEDVVRLRLNGRVDHHLGDKAFAMYERFQTVYEPIETPFFTINSKQDVSDQLDELVQKLS